MGIATATVSSSNLPYQVTTDDPQGQILGPRSTSLVGFYGLNPGVVQPVGNAQAAVTRGNACGDIVQWTLSSSVTSVANNTTTEKSFTLDGATNKGNWQLATTDMVLAVNKPTSDAGIGVGNVRVSAANIVGVTFGNSTAATVTPSTSLSYSFMLVRGFGILSATLSPTSVAANTSNEQTFAVTGIRVGDLIQVNKPTSQAGLDILNVRAVANNSVAIQFGNFTGSVITPTASESYSFMSLGGIDAENNFVTYQTVQSPASVANATSAEQAFTTTGTLTTDTVLGISKPTAQAGLIVSGSNRVSAANTLGITFGNFTAATITPTASQVYEVMVWRQAPTAPLVLYTQTLTPSSVAANTTAEQTFTVTGLIASTSAWVNKPSFQAGLGIYGVRVSATNTLAITYVNLTASAITPASESYTIGNYQAVITDTGSCSIQPAVTASQQRSVLANGIRTAMTTMNQIAGA